MVLNRCISRTPLPSSGKSPAVNPANHASIRQISNIAPGKRSKTGASPLSARWMSGSMTDEQKEIVRIEAFWIDTDQGPLPGH